MQEVSSVIAGERDYSKIRGQTGPLVYPAGFVWIFCALRWLTDEGSNVPRAQLIFAGIYLLTQAVVLALYIRAKLTPAWALILLMLSKRIHSLYALRLFNDSISMLLLYCAIFLFTKRKWAIGCVLYSAAVSVKMNILLFAPSLLYLLLCTGGVAGAVRNIAICAAVQVYLPIPPFLWLCCPIRTAPVRGAFE
jgi:alpha-1,3-mannosyltransferase